MSRKVLAGSLLFVLILTGCGSDDTSSAPPDPAQFNTLRESYLRANPRVRVGMVTAILSAEHLAGVGRVAPKDFHVDDVVSFIDSQGNVLANGRVEAIEKGLVEVRYTPTQRREPMIGDLAIRELQ